MTKKPNKKKPAKKIESGTFTYVRKNQADLTLRNLRAVKKRIDEVEAWAFKNFLALENEIISLEDRLTLAKQGIFVDTKRAKR